MSSGPTNLGWLLPATQGCLVYILPIHLTFKSSCPPLCARYSLCITWVTTFSRSLPFPSFPLLYTASAPLSARDSPFPRPPLPPKYHFPFLTLPFLNSSFLFPSSNVTPPSHLSSLPPALSISPIPLSPYPPVNPSSSSSSSSSSIPKRSVTHLRRPPSVFPRQAISPGRTNFEAPHKTFFRLSITLQAART
ncbi:hypothetical protein E2C01_080994 [Portunus trituberculatus]|uniref:Uncharacterized protein n=1 Tax=Portunus trituberculatus TaxID=210409 RepID=A0A5B7IZV9_PORTR|nr:hypothetical protein [Portunus trituberculatus]